MSDPPSRSPHGERGLKYRADRAVLSLRRSLSSRRAWIEIEQMEAFGTSASKVALLTESVD